MVAADLIAAALVNAGYDPPPYIGQQWRDRRATWLPAGHHRIVTITSIWKVEAGWSVAVEARNDVNENGESSDGPREGVILVEHLVADYEPWTGA